jgi:hypothetical protein
MKETQRSLQFRDSFIPFRSVHVFEEWKREFSAFPISFNRFLFRENLRFFVNRFANKIEIIFGSNKPASNAWATRNRSLSVSISQCASSMFGRQSHALLARQD